ncbi:MAG: hypothetical protein BWX84_01960 [Verrucomicrobia bacterium ADurb.Bin118]|nr:MAG: hypothetical protein BWX84_01960 [Verrucomicrobia bacterium ADurb.Bin118]
MPPRITTPVKTTSPMPVSHGGVWNVACSASATELACTMLPMPNAASAVNRANTLPNHGQPKPFLSTYIAPPRMAPAASGSR